MTEADIAYHSFLVREREFSYKILAKSNVYRTDQLGSVSVDRLSLQGHLGVVLGYLTCFFLLGLILFMFEMRKKVI